MATGKRERWSSQAMNFRRFLGAHFGWFGKCGRDSNRPSSRGEVGWGRVGVLHWWRRAAV